MHEILKGRITQLENHVIQQQQQFDSLHTLYRQSVQRETILVREIQQLRKNYSQQQLTLKATQTQLTQLRFNKDAQKDAYEHTHEHTLEHTQGHTHEHTHEHTQGHTHEHTPCIDVPVDQLEAQYNRELQQLRKLIILKGYKDESGDNQLKAQYEAKMKVIVAQYSLMQQEMSALRRTILNQTHSNIESPIHSPHSDIHSPTYSQLWEQVHGLSHQLALREAENERLLVLYEARMDSKEEYINLLRLKIENQQLNTHDIHY